MRLLLTDSRFFRVSDFTGHDAGLGVFGAVFGGTPDRPYVEIRGKDIIRVHYFPEVHKQVNLAKNVAAAIGGAYIPSLHKLVFVEFASGNISAIDMLTGQRTILGKGYSQAEDIIVNAAGTVAYVTERVGTLLRVDLTPGNADRVNATLISKGMTAPQQISLDEEGAQAYVVEYDKLGNGRLLKIDLDGPTAGTQTVLATRLDQAVGLVVTNDLTTAYVSEQGGGGRLTSINLVDGTRKTIASNVPAIFFLRWANSKQESIVSVQRDPINFVIRFNLARPTEEEPERIMDHLPFRPSSVVILPDDRWVVCSDQELTIFSISVLVPKILDVGGDEFVRHFEDEFARWSQVGEVLEPYTTYRLKVETRAKVFGEGILRNYKKEALTTEFAYFRTEGPPGVAKLAAPAGSERGPKELAGTPLDNLSRYVRSTTPRELVPATATGPARLLYRAYDVGMEFDENYVDLMYKLGRRDLAIQMHDGNGAMRDHKGRRVVITNRWGRATEVTLREREERWLSVLESGSCTTIPLGSIVKNSTFNATTEAHVFSSSALCEARLVPALLHDAFAGYKTTGATGPNGSFERWQIQDGSGSPPSNWTITSSGGTTPDFVLAQTNGAATSTLVLKNAPELDSNHLDQPANWTDYRLTVHLRSTAGRIGVVWHYQDAGNHYRFVMDETGRREVFRIANGLPTSLGFMTIIPPSSHDAHVINIEAEGSSFRISEDGMLRFSITDPTTKKGGIGLYSSGNSLARFTDVAVDDFRSSAPVVYRFSFQTSRFKNFVDHLGSFDEKTWLTQLLASANVAPQIAKAAPVWEPVSEVESRAYDALFAQLPEVPKKTSIVRVTRVEQNGSAIAFLVQSPEPLDWKRINLQLLQGPTFAVRPSKVLRKADGAGLFIVSPAANPAGSLLPPGEYQLVFTYRRDNRAVDSNSEVFSEAGNTGTEESTLEVPWETES